MIIIFYILIFPSFLLATDYEMNNLQASNQFSEESLIKTQYLSDSIMSPYCPGRTLSACPSEKARNLRNEISVFFDRGYSNEAVINHLTARYGSSIKGEPPSKGFWLIAWITPITLILISTIVIFTWINYFKKRNLKNEEVIDKNNLDIINDLKNNLDLRLKDFNEK